MSTGNVVYVSGALSDVPAEIRQGYIEFYEAIGELVESMGLTAYVPHMNTDPIKHKDVTPRHVDLIDRKAVTSSMLEVAVADNPSLGVGIEVEMAYHANVPVVLICHEDKLRDRKISRLIRGNPAVIREISYSDQEDALKQLRKCIIDYLNVLDDGVMPTSLIPRPA